MTPPARVTRAQRRVLEALDRDGVLIRERTARSYRLVEPAGYVSNVPSYAVLAMRQRQWIEAKIDGERWVITAAGRAALKGGA